MSLDDAIADIKKKILAVSPGAEIKVVKMSDEEARLSVLAPAGNLEAIKSATDADQAAKAKTAHPITIRRMGRIRLRFLGFLASTLRACFFGTL